MKKIEQINVIRFDNCFSKKGEVLKLKDFINEIKRPRYRNQDVIRDIREVVRDKNDFFFIDPNEKKTRLKQSLPSYLLQYCNEEGIRNGEEKVFNGLLVLDFDKIEEGILDVKDVLCSSEYSMLCFISPSGVGLKVVVKVKYEGQEQYRDLYDKLSEHYYDLAGIKSDPSQRNFNRLCFVSDDEMIFINEGSKMMDYE